MENIIHTVHGLTHRRAIQDGSLDELVLESGKVALEAGAQVVQDPHLGLALKVFNDMAADEAGAAGDENFHLKCSPRVCSSPFPVV